MENEEVSLNKTLSIEESNMIQDMLKDLESFEYSNSLKEKYYLGEQRVRSLNIAIPPHLSNITTVVGWAGTTVDVLAERLDWQGWSSVDGNDFGLSEVYKSNGLNVEAGHAVTDALIYGTSFIVVGTGYDGEPSPLITVESARNMTGIYNARTRRLDAALGVNVRKNGKAKEVTLYLADSTVTAFSAGSTWIEVERDDHNLGRVPVAQLVNNPRASAVGGRSEITKAVRSYTDQGVRTMLGMEINREFYSFPQRWMMGADLDMFTDEDGNPVPGWQASMTSMLVSPVNEEGGTPTVGQFNPASPAPYVDQLRALSQMVAGEAGMPATYFGFEQANPTSADAIRAGEARLVKRAERRQLMFGRAFREVGAIALLVRDGEVPNEYNTVYNKWTDAATPTRAAAADEVVKLVGGGVLPADSDVVLDRVGLNPHEKQQVANDRQRANASQRLANLRAAAAQPLAEQPATEVA